MDSTACTIGFVDSSRRIIEYPYVGLCSGPAQNVIYRVVVALCGKVGVNICLAPNVIYGVHMVQWCNIGQCSLMPDFYAKYILYGSLYDFIHILL